MVGTAAVFLPRPSAPKALRRRSVSVRATRAMQGRYIAQNPPGASNDRKAVRPVPVSNSYRTMVATILNHR